jgi:homoserine kinase
MGRVTVEVPATSANLGAGFDCLGLALELCNTVTVEELHGTDIEVTVAGCGTTELSRGPDNLVLVAMRHLYAKQGRRLPGIRLDQHNGIPLCSGLGSSAAAEISGLTAANVLLGEPFTARDLALIALELENHPDNIMPALLGGLVVAVAQHRRGGWELAYTRLDPPPLQAVIVTPNLKVETVESRRKLPTRYSRADAVFNIGRAALLVAAVAQGDWAALATALDDRIHQPYRLPAIEGAPEVIAAAKEAGAIGAVLSGSGPTILALCASGGEAVAEAVAAKWREFGVGVNAQVLATRAVGARVVA